MEKTAIVCRKGLIVLKVAENNGMNNLIIK
jgi:hypothetical protein